jgi:hypothetical protein
MDILAAFFKTNQAIIYFAYGLVFFVGLAIALQSRQFSPGTGTRSELAGAFGICMD